MIRGTTPTLTFKYKKKDGTFMDLSDYDCFITLKDTNNTMITYENDRMTFDTEDKTLSITMTQEETLSLHGNSIQFQLRAILNGHAIASAIGVTSLNQILKEGEIC